MVPSMEMARHGTTLSTGYPTTLGDLMGSRSGTLKTLSSTGYALCRAKCGEWIM
jgi:hypothetical protein